jgi:hypothetical protein
MRSFIIVLFNMQYSEIQMRRINWAEHTARMGEKRCACGVVMETPARQGRLDLSVDKTIFKFGLKRNMVAGRGMDSYGSEEGEVVGFVHTIISF